MLISSLFVIILCQYIFIAGKNDANKVVDLDVWTRNDTDKVKVTKEEVKGIVIYNIEPKSGYKIGKFVDGDKVIYETKDNENYKFLQIKCSKANKDLFIAKFKYSNGCFGTPGINYFLFKDGWKKMTIGFYRYILHSINNGSKGSRLEHVDYYNTYLAERSKKRIQIDVNSDTKQVSDLVLEEHTEGNLDKYIYKVKDDAVIYSVKVSPTEIWTRDNYVCGCYELVVYYLEKTVELLILAVKDSGGTTHLYYKKQEQNNYSEIEKAQFDDELKGLKEKKVAKTLNNDESNNNKNQRG